MFGSDQNTASSSQIQISIQQPPEEEIVSKEDKSQSKKDQRKRIVTKDHFKTPFENSFSLKHFKMVKKYDIIYSHSQT